MTTEAQATAEKFHSLQEKPVAEVNHHALAYLAGMAQAYPLPSAPPAEEIGHPAPSAPPAEIEPEVEEFRRVIDRQTWSSYRVRRTALYTLGGMSVTVGIGSLVAVAATVLPPVGIVSGIGFAILGSGLLGWGASIIDYHNSQEVEELRARIVEQPLEKIAQEHSWRRIFKFSILRPEQMYAKFCESARRSSVSSIIAMYDQATEAYAKVGTARQNEYTYTLPHPTSWMWKFQNELSEMNAHQFFSSYKLEALKGHGFISLGAYRDLKVLQTTYSSEVANHTAQVFRIRTLYKGQIDRIEDEKRKEIGRAQSEYDSQPAVVRLRNLDTEFEEKIAGALRGVNERIETAFDRYEAYREGLLHGRNEGELLANERAALATRELEYDAVVAEAQREASRIRENLTTEKRGVQVNLERESHLLDAQRRARIERAAASADRQIFELCTARDREIEILSAPFRARVDSINVRFAEILRNYAILN